MLNRCIVQETARDMQLRNREQIERLRMEFQLERSDLRKKRREVGRLKRGPFPTRLSAPGPQHEERAQGPGMHPHVIGGP